MRELRKDLPRFRGRKVVVTVSRDVAERLLGPEKANLEDAERDLGREIEIRAKPELHQEQFEVTAEEPGEPLSFVPSWLAAPEPEESATPESAATASEPAPAEEPAAREEAAAAEPLTTTAATPDEPAASAGEAPAETAPEPEKAAANPASAALLEPPPPAQPLDFEEESQILPGSEKPEES